MSLQLKTICFLAFLTFVSSKRPFDLIFDELKCFKYGEIVKELTCNKFEKGNNSYISGRLVFSSQVNTFDIRASAEIPRSGGEPISFFNIEIDGCKLLESKEADNLVKLGLQFMRKSGNIPTKCPLKANEIYSLDELLIDADILPNYTPELSFLVPLELLIKNEVIAKALINGRVEIKQKKKRFFII